MDKIKEEITKLTNEWRVLAGRDHCKDRDFHWYINTKWSYGSPPKYAVQHRGYILRYIEEEFESYNDALKGLKNILIQKIKEEKELYKSEDVRQ